MYFTAPPQKSRLPRAIGWTSPPHKEAPSDLLRSDPNPTTSNSKEMNPITEDTPLIFVEQRAHSPLDAFKDAITDGTRLFCEQNVHPLWVLDQQTKFKITGIQVYLPKEKSGFLQVLEQLPIEVRNRMARILMQAAPGAEQQLVIDDDFFGITLDVEPAVVNGQVIRLIATRSHNNSEMKLVFSGKYITDKHSTPSRAAVTETAVPATPSEEANTATATAIPKPSAHAPAIPATDSTLTPKNSALETPLAVPDKPRAEATETPLSSPSHRPIAHIRYQYAGQEQKTTIALTEEMLPFMIGREHTSTGRFNNGLSLVNTDDANCTLLVSREHLEIQRYDPASGHFFVVNHGVNRNGAFQHGSALPERFMLKPQTPNNTIHLGGNADTGTASITIEAAYDI